MDQAEDLKRTRRIIRIRQALYKAENKIWLDAPKKEQQDQIEDALNYLADKLPQNLVKRIFKRCHIKKLTNFWVVVSDRGEFKGMVDGDRTTEVFRAIASFCRKASSRHGEGKGVDISITKPMD